ncbi:unnamed protein product, partial [Scytosiphon promiscuus]
SAISSALNRLSRHRVKLDLHCHDELSISERPLTNAQTRAGYVCHNFCLRNRPTDCLLQRCEAAAAAAAATRNDHEGIGGHVRRSGQRRRQEGAARPPQAQPHPLVYGVGLPNHSAEPLRPQPRRG